MAILSQLAIVIGVVLVGVRHFDNVKAGIAAATLYLLLPYTAMWTGNVTHALPGALLVWAIVFYRWPLLAGAMIGLAFGTIYYPVFLLPLWISFYWQRGLVRFLIGVLLTVGYCHLVLAMKANDMQIFFARTCSRCLGSRFRSRQISRDFGANSGSRFIDIRFRRTCGIEPEHGPLAGTKKSGHADQLFGSRHVGHAVLVRP